MTSQTKQTLHFHLETKPEMLVQEMIYGHRLNTDQEAYMILLETLAVINEVPLGSKKPNPNSLSHEKIEYNLPYKRRIRYLLFKDQYLTKINNDKSIDKVRKWKEWKNKTQHHFTSTSSLEDHFHYLDERFDYNLDELHQAVSLLQSMELDVMNRRRWTSKFLCVTGPDMVLPDFREVNDKWSSDRRFFGRGGELIYLMLNRSDHFSEIQNLIQQKILDDNDPYNLIAKSISPKDPNGSSKTEIGFLPYFFHGAYNRLANAWINILQQELLSGSHFFDPLFRITGLNLILYLSERATESIGSQFVEPILVDLTDGNNFQLRKASKDNLNLHRYLQNQAVKAFITQKVESDPDWKTAKDFNDVKLAANVIYNNFHYEIENIQGFGGLSPTEILKWLIIKAQKRSHNNANSYILSLSKQIGLCTARGSAGTWLSMDDHMIIALVMALVEETIELGVFLTRLFETYNLVIGPAEARKAYKTLPIGNNCFEENLVALEKRMSKLSLTQRLSDDCAFVINPFRNSNA